MNIHRSRTDDSRATCTLSISGAVDGSWCWCQPVMNSQEFNCILFCGVLVVH